MLEGTTKSGFKFEISDDALNDWELLEALDELEHNPQNIITVAKKLLGGKGYQSFKDHLRDKKTGVVPMDKATLEITEILQSNNKTKNS